MSADPQDSKTGRAAPERHRDRLPSGRRDVRINPFRRTIVTMLKLVLPMIAAALLALIVLWPQIQQVQESGFRLGFSSSPSDLMENVAMNKPRFFGVDGNKQPFTVTANEAIEEAGDGTADQPKHVKLDAPQADMTLKDGSWVALTADKGLYQEKNSRLNLTGEVNMYHDQGFELHTDQASIFLNKGSAEGTKPVDGQGPFGTIKSDSGFELEDKGAVIRFLGNAKLVIFDNALKGKS